MEVGVKVFSQYKLIKHIDKLCEWQNTGFTYPFLVNINLTNICNNRCPKCTSRKKDRTTLTSEKAKEIIFELRGLGIKSIGLGGGGDPSCHPDLASLIRYTKNMGIEVAVHTNGFKLSDDLIAAIASCCTWVRISLDANNPELYSKIHGMPDKAFDMVINNIQKLVSKKREINSDIVIGITYLIDETTINGAYEATKIVKAIGVDNIRFRSFFNWENYSIKNSKKSEIIRELDRCLKLSNNKFQVSYAKERIDSLGGERKRRFSECLVHHFSTIITPDCKVYPCCMLMDDNHYCYGDLSKMSFQEIWSSARRKNIYDSINLKECPNPCMMEVHNDLLTAIKTNEIGDFSIKEIINAMNAPIEHSNWI